MTLLNRNSVRRGAMRAAAQTAFFRRSPMPIRRPGACEKTKAVATSWHRPWRPESGRASATAPGLLWIASLGLHVTCAANAAEALQVRAERPGLPVTVITGYAENVQAAVDAGLDVLHKPLALEELLGRLRGAFGER